MQYSTTTTTTPLSKTRTWQAIAILPDGSVAVRDREGKLDTFTVERLADLAERTEVLAACGRRLSPADAAAGRIL